jgi:hypothetical protein
MPPQKDSLARDEGSVGKALEMTFIIPNVREVK